jgi:hypothetical protein
MGFIPSKSGINFNQPPAVKEFIRFFFIAVPVLLALISFLLKMKFPIDSEKKMTNLRKCITVQNSKSNDVLNNNDYFKIKNPIFNKEHVQIVCKSQRQKSTKIVADHFNNIEYLELLLKADYKSVRKWVTLVLAFELLLIIFLFVVILMTFKYLEIKSLSLIPIFALMSMTVTILFAIVSSTRLIMINKVISGEYEIDEKYLTLYIYQFKNSEEMVKTENELCGGEKIEEDEEN